jgi:eukaryotic-like serine/threonine-protein kinase
VEDEADKRARDVDAETIESGAPVPEPEVTLDIFAAAALSGAERALTEPKSIGPYRLIRKLGEGGMGQIWLAEQTEPIQRQVALKLIKVGRYDDSVLRRFYSERQSLAIMDHPSIAKVFEAGATPDGQPYFVMEYVPGPPITAYCNRKQLTIRERLELFVKVCEGVQHAHQRAVMHRDLKPDNILVIEVDGKPVPRIIDFGLAKAANPQLHGETVFTQAGGWVGTPGYMSPEQVDPAVVDVDTRTDVYSLGAVLYELLTGFLPFDTKDWRKQRWDEYLRRLREEDPPTPSTKVHTEKQSSKVTSEARGTEPKQLVSLLQGDLDWITMKALEKDRARRYSTPMELAADIGRYLNNEPILARPASTAYRWRKYVRRHRVGVAVVSGLVLVLAGFALTQAVEVRRITRERDRANRIADFMKGIFRVPNPSEARGNAVTAREILDMASQQIGTNLSKDPELQAELIETMSQTYTGLGLYRRAQDLTEQALSVERSRFGEGNRRTLETESYLGQLLRAQGHLPEAEKLSEGNHRRAARGFRAERSRHLGLDGPSRLCLYQRSSS